MDGLDKIDTEAHQPAGQRLKAVAHPSVPRRSLGEDLVAEDEEPHDRPSSDGGGVVPSSSRESDPCRRHDRALRESAPPLRGTPRLRAGRRLPSELDRERIRPCR